MTDFWARAQKATHQAMDYPELKEARDAKLAARTGFWQGPISGTMTCADCHAMVAGAHMGRHIEWHSRQPPERLPPSMWALREEGDPAGSDEQAQDDEDDSHEEGASDEADDAPDDEDDGEDPEQQVHDLFLPVARAFEAAAEGLAEVLRRIWADDRPRP